MIVFDFLFYAHIKIEYIELNDILGVLRKYCSAVDLRRFDETEELIEASFSIEIEDFEKLNEAKTELRKLSKSIQITFLDNKGIT